MAKKLSRNSVKKCAKKLGARGGISTAGYFPPPKTPAVTRCAKKLAKRRNNPVGLSRTQKITAAMKLFQQFHVMDPQYIDELDTQSPDVCVAIGPCDGILYTTVRDGKREQYIHEFSKKSRPILAASYDGKQLFILRGNYRFTKRGIVDR